MTSPTSPSRRHALLTAAAFVAGCSQPAPLKSTFLLEPAHPAPAGVAARPTTLKVDPVLVADAFRGRSLVYRDSELKYEADFYNEFLIAPPAMIGAAIVDWLAAAGLYQNVLPPSSALDGEERLEAFVSELYGDFRDAAKPAAVVTIRFFLADAQAAPGNFLWTGELRARRDIAVRLADALVTGLNAALGDVLAQLAVALRSLPVK